MRAWIARQMVTLTGLFALAFCGTLAGTWGCGDDDEGGGACGAVPSECSALEGSDECGNCMASCCCTQTIACASSSACTDLLSCVAECTTDSCADTCMNSYSSGVTPLMNLLECVEGKCSSPCS